MLEAFCQNTARRFAPILHHESMKCEAVKAQAAVTGAQNINDTPRIVFGFQWLQKLIPRAITVRVEQMLYDIVPVTPTTGLRPHFSS